MPATTADRELEVAKTGGYLIDTLLAMDLGTIPSSAGPVLDILRTLWDSAYEAGRQDAAQ